MWRLTPEQRKIMRELARDVAHGILFVTAIAMIVVGAFLTSPADLGLIAAAAGLIGIIGIGRA